MRLQSTVQNKAAFNGSRLNVLTASKKARTPKHAKVDRRNDDHFLSPELTEWEVMMLDRQMESDVVLGIGGAY